MVEFKYFQADVDTIDSEIEDEVNNGRDELTSLTDYSFEGDNDPLFYYQLHNISRNVDEVITNFLSYDNETTSTEISNYCQKSFSDDDDDDDEKTDNLLY